jgi:hypothetical protein
LVIGNFGLYHCTDPVMRIDDDGWSLSLVERSNRGVLRPLVPAFVIR